MITNIRKILNTISCSGHIRTYIIPNIIVKRNAADAVLVPAKKMLRNMRTRSCYQCLYAQRQRVGDITVGDYWGVQKYDPQLLVEQGGTINSKEGVSCLLINTECGQHLVEKYGAKIESYPVEFSNIAQVNTQLNRPTKHTRLRNKIFRKYKASGYAGVEAIFERDQRNQKFIWGMYDRICGMFCRKTR